MTLSNYFEETANAFDDLLVSSGIAPILDPNT